MKRINLKQVVRGGARSAALLVCSILAAPSLAQATVAGNLYVTNDSNAVQAFNVSTTGDPSATGSPVSSGGSYPLGASMAPDGTHLYSTNNAYGAQAYVSTYVVSGASIQPATTTSLGNNPTTPTAVQTQAEATAVALSGRFLYVAVAGGTYEGVIDVLPLTDGVPGTPIQEVAESGPVGLTVSPDGNNLYVNDAGDQAVESYSIAPATGLLTAVGSPASNPSNYPGGGITETPDSKYVYATSYGAGVGGHGTVTEYSVGAAGALSLTNTYNTLGAGPLDAVASPDGKNLYYSADCSAVDQSNPTAGVSCTSTGSVGSYKVNADGTLTSTGLQSSQGLNSYGIAVSPDSQHVYATNYYPTGGGNHPGVLGTFSVQTDGSLLAQGSPVQTGGVGPDYQSVVVAPDQAPTAKLAAPTPASSVAPGTSVSFDATGSSAFGTATIARYDWNFGDGTTATNAGAKPSHVYTTPGNYTVTVTVTDSEGCSTLVISTGPTASCNGGPTATASQMESVTHATPTISTTPSSGGPVGTTVHDVAHLSGLASPDNTGSVSFKLYPAGDSTCSGTPTTLAATPSTVATNRDYTSADTTPATPGTYHWIATYTGDSNNTSVATNCSDETVTISNPVIIGPPTTKATPTISTTPSSGGPVGTTVHDVAHLSGLASPDSTGTVSFALYPDATCTGTPTILAATPTNVGANGDYTSANTTPATPGTYHWIATYTGDTNNTSVATNCSDETVTITQADVVAQAPTVAESCRPSSVGVSSAVLSSSVDPNGSSTTVRFDYGTTTSYGSHTAGQALGAGFAYQSVHATLSGLAPRTLFHCRAVATNSVGTTYGADQSFTTGSALGAPRAKAALRVTHVGSRAIGHGCQTELNEASTASVPKCNQASMMFLGTIDPRADGQVLSITLRATIANRRFLYKGNARVSRGRFTLIVRLPGRNTDAFHDRRRNRRGDRWTYVISYPGTRSLLSATVTGSFTLEAEPRER